MSRGNSRRAPVVLKFGGESLSAPEAVVRVVRQTRRRGARAVVVSSAREGVTDLLRRYVQEPALSATVLRAELEALHPDLPPAGRRILERTSRLAVSLRRSGLAATPAADELLSQGERLAVHWLADRLTRAGVPATPVEADRLGLVTDNSYGASRILLDRSAPSVRRGLERIWAAGRVPVVTGFFGRSLEGRVATLGRGGSDYSASALGAIVGASRVELVKRHVAIYTADPQLVAAARPVDYLSYEEAEEFAQFGARVLHPVTIEPARSGGVELRVRSLHDGDLRTVIGPARPGRPTHTVTLLGPLRSVSLRIAGGRQRRGIIAVLGQRLAAAGVNLVAVVTTEAVAGLLVDPAEEARAMEVLREAAIPLGASVGRPVAVSLVSAVGESILADLPRLGASDLAGALGVLATWRSISLVVPEGRAVRTLRALHRAFVETPRRRSPGRAGLTAAVPGDGWFATAGR